RVTDLVSAEQVRARHDRLLRRLREVADAHGHDPGRLRIVGVTKEHPLEVVAAAVDAGLTRLGESRVQEAEPKSAAFPAIEWHFIGRLQSNKARRAVRSFPVIHSIDSPELLQRVDRIADEEGRRPQVLLEVNVSGEATKAGLRPEDLDEISAPAVAELVGLMTIARFGASEEEARAVFARLRALRDRLQQRLGRELPELSMGMSADAEAAAAEGATYVRIGTALFGPRH
ncbi:MAG TPA: YggS family pyridoxal phosphate-dependent enzyme, partial [Candidatus Limnocylindria bacterium]|nr:YggS family pyridoxal phosphate-dependent enzyme [Candidatus Limnocylindria bacterium]